VGATALRRRTFIAIIAVELTKSLVGKLGSVALRMAAHGMNRTSSDVRLESAIEGKAEVGIWGGQGSF